MNTSVVRGDNTIVTEKKDWGEQLTLGLMIGGPIYLAIIVLLVVFISKQCREGRHRVEDEGSQNQVDSNIQDVEAIHYWIPFTDNDENDGYMQ